MKLQELFEDQTSMKDLAKGSIKDAGTHVRDWFGTGTFTEICNEPGNCAMASEKFIDWLKQKKIKAKSITGSKARDPSWLKRTHIQPGSEDDAHTVALVDGNIIDFTAKQFDSSLPFPRIVPLSTFRDEWETIV